MSLPGPTRPCHLPDLASSCSSPHLLHSCHTSHLAFLRTHQCYIYLRAFALAASLCLCHSTPPPPDILWLLLFPPSGFFSDTIQRCNTFHLFLLSCFISHCSTPHRLTCKTDFVVAFIMSPSLGCLLQQSTNYYYALFTSVSPSPGL